MNEKGVKDVDNASKKGSEELLDNFLSEDDSNPFVINGDGTLLDFLKYLEAVGVKLNNKAFFGALKNQIRAYNFTCSGGVGGLWKLSSKLRSLKPNKED